jgi:hypothetical protein
MGKTAPARGRVTRGYAGTASIVRYRVQLDLFPSLPRQVKCPIEAPETPETPAARAARIKWAEWAARPCPL